MNCESVTQVLVELKKDLLGHFDVQSWNLFVEELIEKNVLAATWRPGERPPSLVVFLDFRGLRMRNRHLDGIHLGVASLEEADFSRASLRNAKIGCCRYALFTGARLDGADFEYCEISGADFTDATGIETAKFRRASYFVGNPPVGLPPSVIAQCDPHAEPPLADWSFSHTPMEESQSPLRCVAAICETPMGEL